MEVIAKYARGVIPRRYRPAAKRLYYRLLPTGERRRLLARQLRGQAKICASFRSPLYASLLRAAAADVEAGGPCWALLSREPQTEFGADDALPLRFMGAVHRLVLSGAAPELARFYPSVGGVARAGEARPAFRRTVARSLDELASLVGQTQAVQTNEVGRCAVLAPGFLLVARDTRLPLRILEVGASAGLNLRWDHYRYEVDGACWGDPHSPVRLGDAFVEGHPDLDIDLHVVSRTGCDLNPIDPCSEEGRLALMSYVWADQADRLELLRNAFEIAARVPATVERADAADWLERELESTDGVATVVCHSFVAQFFSEITQSRFEAVLASAAARATSGAPLAWLRMEWGNGQAETRLTRWPGGTEQLLATSTPQGWDIHWRAC